MRNQIIGLLVWFSCIGAPYVHAQQFVDLDGAANGLVGFIGPESMGIGLAAADVDDDGHVDIFVPNREGHHDLFFHNNGDGTFTDLAQVIGIGSVRQTRNAIWFDFDGDHDLDLLTAEDCFVGPETPIFSCLQTLPLALYRQDAPLQFSNATYDANLAIPFPRIEIEHHGGFAVGDLNNDGWLDVFVGIWQGPAFLFLNNRNGGFVDATVSSGIAGPDRGYFQPVLIDLNADGWMDIVMAVDLGPNIIWINQRDGTFVDVAPSLGVDSAFNEMGNAVGDIDNDGDFDFFMTNIDWLDRHNILLRNDSVGTEVLFSEIAVQLGLGYTGWAWGTTMFDGNNDGLLDIALTNGWRLEAYQSDQSAYFRQLPGASLNFEQVATQVGFDDTDWGSALAAVDYDRDGDLDLLQTCMQSGPLRLYRNNLTPVQKWLTVKPRMNGPNHRAIGAAVKVSAPGFFAQRLITAGVSFLTQEPAEAHLGLGTQAFVDVTVNWPDGTSTTVPAVSANQMLVINHGGPGDLNADGVVNDADLTLFEPCFTGSSNGTIIYVDECRAADVDADGDVDCEDIQFVLQRDEADFASTPILPIAEFVDILLARGLLPSRICLADINVDGIIDGRDIESYVIDLLS